jgi:hypothetical protein
VKPRHIWIRFASNADVTQLEQCAAVSEFNKSVLYASDVNQHGHLDARYMDAVAIEKLLQ